MTSDLASLLFGDAAVEGVEQTSNGGNNVIAWINANPPDLPKHQNSCAACGKYIPVHDTDWVILGDGALVHYSGKHGQVCWEHWQQIRNNEAKLATMEQ
jgi:hypothetical protein